MRVKIISDSTCDLSPELLERYDIAITPLCVIKVIYASATEAKHTSLYALLRNRHPCRFWLGYEQSSKNI